MMSTKTPDEIKKGLGCCISHFMESCNACPYAHISGCARESTSDALALIQQLEADNAQQARCIENLTDKLNATNEALPRWISVEERLPEDCSYVIVYLRNKHNDNKDIWHIDADYFEDGDWHRYPEHGYYNVTHWMPLPEPPNAEKRHAQVGDFVKIIKVTSPVKSFRVGGIYKVVQLEEEWKIPGAVILDCGGYYASPQEYEVLEGYKPDTKEE